MYISPNNNKKSTSVEKIKMIGTLYTDMNIILWRILIHVKLKIELKEYILSTIHFHRNMTPKK